MENKDSAQLFYTGLFSDAWKVGDFSVVCMYVHDRLQLSRFWPVRVEVRDTPSQTCSEEGQDARLSSTGGRCGGAGGGEQNMLSCFQSLFHSELTIDWFVTYGK